MYFQHVHRLEQYFRLISTCMIFFVCNSVVTPTPDFALYEYLCDLMLAPFSSPSNITVMARIPSCNEPFLIPFRVLSFQPYPLFAVDYPFITGQFLFYVNNFTAVKGAGMSFSLLSATVLLLLLWLVTEAGFLVLKHGFCFGKYYLKNFPWCSF